MDIIILVFVVLAFLITICNLGITCFVLKSLFQLQKAATERDQSISENLITFIKQLGEDLQKRDGIFAEGLKDTFEQLDDLNANFQRLLGQRNLLDITDYNQLR